LQDNKTGDDIAEATARKGSHSSVDVGKRKHKSEKSKHRSREVSQNLDSEKVRFHHVSHRIRILLINYHHRRGTQSNLKVFQHRHSYQPPELTESQNLRANLN